MSHAKAGPKELAPRAQREEKAAKRRPHRRVLPKLIPYAGQQDKPVRGGKGSPNRPKQKAKQ